MHLKATFGFYADDLRRRDGGQAIRTDFVMHVRTKHLYKIDGLNRVIGGNKIADTAPESGVHILRNEKYLQSKPDFIDGLRMWIVRPTH